jgi:hypothetical protein
MSEQQVAFSVRLPAPQHDKLRRVAFARNVSLAKVVQEAIRAVPDIAVEVRDTADAE